MTEVYNDAREIPASVVHILDDDGDPWERCDDNGENAGMWACVEYVMDVHPAPFPAPFREVRYVD